MAKDRATAKDGYAQAAELGRVGCRFGGHFAPSEPWRRAADYLKGLLDDAERKNGRQEAAYLGDDPGGRD